MLVKITNGSVAFGADTVLENINFEIRDGEKIAIVGRNGSGKSTLLKALTGEVALEEGTGEETFSFVKSGNPTIGFLKQIAFSDESKSLLDEILTVFKPLTDMEEKMQVLQSELEVNPDEKKINAYANLCDRYEFYGGYTYKKEYSVMIKKFGFTEQEKYKPLSEFSGGQRTKIAFMKLLLSHPDVLLLDEPTNHLDVGAVKWLEGYIKSYKSAVVVVSHDRMFIERTVDKVYEIEYGETKLYHGNYSAFEREKKVNYEKQLKDHELQRQDINRLMRLVERFRYKATKAKMVQSKLKQIERMKIVDKPNRYDLKTFHADFQPEIESVKKVLNIVELTIGYDKPLATVNLELLKGDKLGVIGDNGIGKSTLLKTLIGKINALGGEYQFGVKTQIGYFDQQMAEYKSPKTVFDDFHDAFPLLNETQVRSALGAFLFTGEDVFKCVSDLSGGERVRLALCKILKNRPNVLILDEPTNHMDIVGKETLENMLSAFNGTVIFVSHDRYFISKVATKILAFKDDNVEFYPYNYNEYELHENELEEKAERELTKDLPDNKKETKEKKTFSTPLKEKGKKQRRVSKLEELIAKCEQEISELNEHLSRPDVYSDYVKVGEIEEKLSNIKIKQDEYTEEWLILSEELENF